MKFYGFTQNNSGGKFLIDDTKGIGPLLWIEAPSAKAADAAAERMGLYFDGVNRGLDCSCCGDRWHPAWEADGCGRSEISDTEYGFYWHDTVYVHHADGTIERIRDPHLAGERG